VTGIGIPQCILDALDQGAKPAAVQCLTNPIDSAGELKYYEGGTRARDIIARAKEVGAGTLGIRPVQGGALTDKLDRDLPADHGVVTDFNRLGAFRALAGDLGCSAAALAHRYALSMPGVDTVVLGCKNREEIMDCIRAAEAGPLDAETMERIDQACA
jgi:aryl-alcohol dehydrogenase-like predicted oxidoreductase